MCVGVWLVSIGSTRYSRARGFVALQFKIKFSTSVFCGVVVSSPWRGGPAGNSCPDWLMTISKYFCRVAAGLATAAYETGRRYICPATGYRLEWQWHRRSLRPFHNFSTPVLTPSGPIMMPQNPKDCAIKLLLIEF